MNHRSPNSGLIIRKRFFSTSSVTKTELLWYIRPWLDLHGGCIIVNDWATVVIYYRKIFVTIRFLYSYRISVVIWLHAVDFHVVFLYSFVFVFEIVVGHILIRMKIVGLRLIVVIIEWIWKIYSKVIKP